MYKGIRIAAVVPAHNEEAHIKDVIVLMPEIVDIIAITDDCSTDRTAEIAENTGDERVFVSRHTVNTGVGGAIITAHKVAIDNGSQINIVFAGDGQMDPNYLTSLLDPIIDGKYGFTKGNRLFSRTSHEGMPKYRIFGNYILSYMHKAVGGYWHVSDPQNGYTAIRTDILSNINFDSISGGYEFENDLLSRLNEYGIPVLDVSIPALYRDEVSGIKLSKVIPALLKNFVVSYFGRISRKYLKKGKVLPILCFGTAVLGILFSLYGVATLSWGRTTIGLGTALISFCSICIFDYMSEPKSWDPARMMSTSSIEK